MADDLIQGGETAYYRALITQYDKSASKWQTRAKKIVKRYLDERTDSQVSVLRYNILWSNVETLKPAIYAQSPKPEVERRFHDKDPVGRMASQVLERCISYFVATTAFGSTMRQSRDDYLLVGRGISWVRYVPTLKNVPGQLTDDAPTQEIDYEDVLSDYVHWKDFGHNVARTWEEVEVVWRVVYLTREQMKARGFEAWNEVPLDYVDKDIKELASDDGKKATVYEIWDKAKRKALWIAKAWPKYLDVKPDPLKLDKFFPCSRPIYATLANESLIPVPDYAEYQDQAQEIDEITNRIGLIQKAIKAAGIYDANTPALKRLLDEGTNNQLIPVDSWAALAEKGGLKGTFELLPMLEIAQTLLALYETREKVKADLYEITGMSDIIRGATNANETATAQKIKSNFVTLRLSEKQREMQRFARNTIEIMGNIIARHFQLETIQKISGVKLLTQEQKAQVQAAMAQAQQQAQMAQQAGQQPPPPPQIPDEIQEKMSEPTWEEVFGLLRDSPDRCFRITIETDSTIAADRAQEQESAVQFVQALGGFIQSTQEAVTQNPMLAPLAGQMLAFAVRRFPVGRELEGVIDETIEKMTKAAEQPQEPKPDPAMAKVEAQAAADKAKLESAHALAMQKMQTDGQLEQMKSQMAQQAEAAKAEREIQMAVITGHLDEQREQARMEMEQRMEAAQQIMQANFDRWKAELDAKTKIEVAEIAAGATLDAAQISAANQGAEE